MAYGQDWVLGSCVWTGRARVSGINTGVTGGGELGRQEKDKTVWPRVLRSCRVSPAGEAGGGLPCLLNKASGPHLPQKKRQAQGFDGFEHDWCPARNGWLIPGFDFSLASRTGLGIVLIT